MPVTPAQVATELARPTPDSSVVAQWQSWIDRAYRLVRDRFTDAAYAALDPARVDDVVLVAVSEHVRAWRDSTARRSTTTIDDGTVSREYENPAGLLSIPASLWAQLDPAASDSGAHSVTPYFAPDRPLSWPWP